MKIVDVEVAWIQLPLPIGRGLSGGPITASTDLICRVTASDGVTGIGEARGASLPLMAEVVNEGLRPLLVGEEAAATQYLRTKIERALLDPTSAGRRPSWTRNALLGAIAAVDLALWEIKAKAAGLSVCRLLGGAPHPVPAYCSAGFFIEGQSLEEMAQETLDEVRARGFRATKIRVGRGAPEDSAARVRAVREAVGPDIQIMVDANQAWTTEEAIAHARAMEPFGVSWLEEPLPSPNRAHRATKEVRDWDAETAKVGEATTIPIASGENHVTLAECRDLIDKGRVRYMQFDCIKNGGLTEFQKVAAYAEATGVALAPHHVPHFHVQIAAAHPHTAWVEAFDNAKQHVAWLDLFPGYPEVRDGHMECHDRPGWGFEVNEELLRTRGTLVHWRDRG
ncbi:MAG TPA: mandelate racemase/muconate lactonizing enzyme family protein [Chloroflexota bacterium]|jgi:L-alanine-DL-glutamate epimerase-like enolase superfamily enzyme|nr:mandelate racemase/muconate lactonizing enzyme family protein [Chloroflexota bacterium]